MNARFTTQKFNLAENVFQQPFTALNGCLIHSLLSVCLFWRKGFYRAFPSCGRSGPQKKRYFSVLFIDWEAQFQCTMNMFIRCGNCTKMWRIPFTGCSSLDHSKRCLSVSARVDMLEPGVAWVRQPPEYAITDMAYFPFTVMPLPLKNLFRHFRPVCR